MTKNRKHRPFTQAEDRRLVALRLLYPGSTGAPRKSERGRGGLKVIAEKLGRPIGSCWYRLKKLAEQEDD